MKRSNVVDNGDEMLASGRARVRDDRSRQWQLTENNPTYTKKEAVERLTSIGQALYSIGCEENGASGTRHIHAYVVYKNAIELASLKRMFPRAHFEHCRGNVRSNVEYISKDDPKPYEVGEMPITLGSEGTSEVASEIVRMLRGQCTLTNILTMYPAYSHYIIRNYKTLKDLERVFVKGLR